jgi:flagellar export protein FliJ
MTKLDGLIRVQKHRVDEKQKILARLYREQEEIEQKKQDLIDQVESERQVAASMQQDVLTQLAFARFSDNAKKTLEQIEGQINTIRMRVSLAQEDIRKAFEDMKKTEIVDQNRQEAEQKAATKKENTELDEIGIETHRRNRNKN